MKASAFKPTTATLVLLAAGLLLSVSGFSSGHASAGATIFIEADGTIFPSTAPISSYDNVTYTQIGDIYEQIQIERENIVFNGAGHVIQGNGTGIGIHIFNRNNVTIRNVQAQSFQYGIYLDASSNSTIVDNHATNNVQGINIDTCENNTVTENYVRNSQTQSNAGIWVFYSQWSNITNNTVVDSLGAGIQVKHSSNITVMGNTLINNGAGLQLDYVMSCTFKENQIAHSQFGASLFYSLGNAFFHNNFTSNTMQVQVSPAGYGNTWDNDYPSGGNHWTDYNGTDINMDGLGDTPYVIDQDNADRYPYMNPVIVPEFASTVMLALFMLAGSTALAASKTRTVRTVNHSPSPSPRAT